MKNYPILQLIPHGGLFLPPELAPYNILSESDILIESDFMAESIFANDKKTKACLNFEYSKLFIDLDRHQYDVYPKTTDGVIKKISMYQKNIFPKNVYPDSLAISKIIERYYTPYYRTINKILNSGEIELILECHTVMPIGTENSEYHERPRPIIEIQTAYTNSKTDKFSAPQKTAEIFLNNFQKAFCKRTAIKKDSIILNNVAARGNLINEFGGKKVPYLRILLNRSLYFNERYFNESTLTINEQILTDLNKRFWEAIEKSYKEL